MLIEIIGVQRQTARRERKLEHYPASVMEPRSENKYFDQTSEYILPRLWNTLPTNLRSLKKKC